MTTLRQLRYLASLARTRHFGKAAEQCSVTQPALSMQVRELERELGVELIERRPGEIALTETGLDVARRADRILAATRDLVDFARHRGLLTGSLRLGIIPTLAPYILPRVLPRLQRGYPTLRLDVRETQTRTLVEEMVAGSLDLIMLALPVEGHDLETLALFDDAFLLAVPAADKLRGRISVDDVDQRRLILLEEGHCLRDQALAFCGTLRRDVAASRGVTSLGATSPGATSLGATSLGATSLGATSLTTVMQIVANGYGVTLVPEVAADTEVRDERVRLLRFAAPQPGRTIGLAWRRTSPRRRDFEAFGDVVRQAIRAAPAKARTAK